LCCEGSVFVEAIFSCTHVGSSTTVATDDKKHRAITGETEAKRRAVACGDRCRSVDGIESHRLVAARTGRWRFIVIVVSIVSIVVAIGLDEFVIDGGVVVITYNEFSDFSDCDDNNNNNDDDSCAIVNNSSSCAC
jgi:hypothetical protein